MRNKKLKRRRLSGSLRSQSLPELGRFDVLRTAKTAGEMARRSAKTAGGANDGGVKDVRQRLSAPMRQRRRVTAVAGEGRRPSGRLARPAQEPAMRRRWPYTASTAETVGASPGRLRRYRRRLAQPDKVCHSRHLPFPVHTLYRNLTSFIFPADFCSKSAGKLTELINGNNSRNRRKKSLRMLSPSAKKSFLRCRFSSAN